MSSPLPSPHSTLPIPLVLLWTSSLAFKATHDCLSSPISSMSPSVTDVVHSVLFTGPRGSRGPACPLPCQHLSLILQSPAQCLLLPRLSPALSTVRNCSFLWIFVEHTLIMSLINTSTRMYFLKIFTFIQLLWLHHKYKKASTGSCNYTKICHKLIEIIYIIYVGSLHLCFFVP